MCLITGSLLMLGFKTVAQSTSGETRENWAPADIDYDGNGNPYAYWNDVNNWSDGILPTEEDTNGDAYAGTYVSACFNEPVAASGDVLCIVTNDQDAGHIYAGFGGGGVGYIIVTNANSLPGGVQLKAAFHDGGGDWTGIGFVDGPGFLTVEPGCDFSCDGNFWVGNSGPQQGFITVNGGTLHVEQGQFGIGWNGIGDTNYCWATNGAHIYVDQMSIGSLGGPGAAAPGHAPAVGYLDIGLGSSFVTTNNLVTATFNNQYTGINGVNDLNFWETNGQLTGLEGTGQVEAKYNPANNTTTLSSAPLPGLQTPVFSTQPSNAVVTVGGTAHFTAVVSNVGVNYLWQFNGANLTDGNGISGSATSTLTIADLTTAETGIYQCTATNSSASTYSTSSTAVSLTSQAFGLYPVISINGINGDTYVTEYTTSLTAPVTWTPFATNTLGAGVQYVIDLSTPQSMSRFYQVVQLP